MSQIDLFCPTCSTYNPTGVMCPVCNHRRPSTQIPIAPDRPRWTAELPGGVAGRLALAGNAEDALLIVPWGHVPRRGDERPPDGGVSALRLSGGESLWTVRLGIPVRGGAVLAGDTVIVGTEWRGIGAGKGDLIALDLRSGEESWRVAMGGAIRSAPVVDVVRVYVTAGDGALYCLDVRDGEQVWRTPIVGFPTPIPASPALVREGGAVQAIITATYGAAHGRKDGQVVAFDERGRKLWVHEAGGNVRGTPAVADGRVYVAAHRSAPSAGVLSALDVRTGRAVWPQPFAVSGAAGDRRQCGFSAPPLAHEGTLYVGSLNGRLYALDAATGKWLWAHEAGDAIATGPAWSEGLIVFGANDGTVTALDHSNGKPVWTHGLGGHALTDPLAAQGTVYAGADNGVIAALPWHLGRYEWAAECSEAGERFAEAGDNRALAAHFSLQPAAHNPCYRLAEEDWTKAGEPEKAARMWIALDERQRAADTYCTAGQRWRARDQPRAAKYFKQAADLYFRMRDRETLNNCTRSLATCERLPFVLLQAVNVGSFIQWEEGEFTLRLVNEGPAPIHGGVRLWIGGALRSAQTAEIRGVLEPGAMWNIPLTIVPTREHSTLEVEVDYDPGVPEYAPLRGMLEVPIEAVEPPQKPLQIGDVGMLKLTIAGSTEEGLTIVTGDTGMVRADGGIGSMQVGGDVGSIRTR